MFTTKSTANRLNNIIETLRSNVKNKDILDYILSKLLRLSNKTTLIRIQNDNQVLIIESKSNDTFYLEISPSLDVIDKIYVRITKGNEDYDERLTATFNGDTTTVNSIASSIIKSKEDHRIERITDRFEDKKYINDELAFLKRLTTNTVYPEMSSACVESTLEKITINESGEAAFKRVKLSSMSDEELRYGLFDVKSTNFTADSEIDSLEQVDFVDEVVYQAFLRDANKRINKELKK